MHAHPPGVQACVCLLLPLCTRACPFQVRVFSMPFGDGKHVMWQLSFPTSEALARRVSVHGASLKAEAVRRCGAWHDPLASMLRETDPALISGHPVYDRDPLTSAQLVAARSNTACAPGLPRDVAQRVTLLGARKCHVRDREGQGAPLCQAGCDGVCV